MIIEKSENRKPLLETAMELVELSLHDDGCVDYDLFGSMTNDDRLMIYETWKNRHDLEKHMASEHFKRLVPRLQELSTMTLEEFSF